MSPWSGTSSGLSSSDICRVNRLQSFPAIHNLYNINSTLSYQLLPALGPLNLVTVHHAYKIWYLQLVRLQALKWWTGIKQRVHDCAHSYAIRSVLVFCNYTCSSSFSENLDMKRITGESNQKQCLLILLTTPQVQVQQKLKHAITLNCCSIPETKAVLSKYTSWGNFHLPTGRQLKQSVKVFHNFILYLLLHSS